MNNTERLQACLQRVVCDPRFTLAELDQWFTPDYCQQVNGEQLDYAAFRQHIATLRDHLAEATIEFVATIAQGDRVHSTHVVRATRHDGAPLVCKVSGLFTFRDGKICQTDEVTCLLSGSKQDADIGSRR
ncbi:nuclear transport factor 2 family protein [Aeromonas veronii]|uniref:nuclear transport factor 2 family protein n=1 Tax=Aeromonas TaxID=642 RepID=UPI00300632FA